MIIAFNHFIKSVKIAQTYHIGTDVSGAEWFIKGYHPARSQSTSNRYNLAVVKEAFAGALYHLFVGSRYAPESRLLIYATPDKDKCYASATRLNRCYQRFQNLLLRYSKNTGTQRIRHAALDGLELHILVSYLLKEQDFLGNGNIGIDLTNRDERDPLAYFRIDFGQIFDAQNIKGFQEIHSLGEMLRELDVPTMFLWRLLNREKAMAAIKAIIAIDDNKIDALFSEFKPYFDEAIAKADPSDPHLDKYLGASYGTSTRYEYLVTELKQNKAKLADNLRLYQRPTKLHPLFFKPKQIPIKATEELRQLRSFFEIYQGFYTPLYENYPQQAAQELYLGLYQHGKNASVYLDYQAKRDTLREIFKNDRVLLKNRSNYLKQLQQYACYFPDYQQHRAKILKLIANRKTRDKLNDKMEQEIAATDKTIAILIENRELMNDKTYAATTQKMR